MMERIAELTTGLCEPAIPMTRAEYDKWQCELENSLTGSLTGYNCIDCKNRGYFAVIKEDGNRALRECECMKIRRSQARIEASGLGHLVSRSTFERYETPEPWQKRAKEKAVEYAEQDSDKWFFFGGQTGCGKTHLCTAICREKMLRGRDVRYLIWFEILRELSGCKYRYDDYDAKMREIKDYDILYIDDFLKCDNSRTPSSEELKIAEEIIWARDQVEKPTILSTEWLIDDILRFDEALGSRIAKRSEKVQILREDNRNYRIRQGG